MKKHSGIFRIIVSFVIITMIVFGTNLSAYADIELSLTCPKALCSKKVQLCGPLLYGATIPSSVPYLGGSTVNTSNTLDATVRYMTTDDHYYIAYCPSYTNSDLSKHAMATFRFSHNYVAQSYDQLTADVTSGGTTYGKGGYHLTTYKCMGSKRVNSTGTFISQELADGILIDGFLSKTEFETILAITDTKSCGTVKKVYEKHTWTHGNWTSVDGIYHQRTNTCSDCGYTTTEKTLHNTSSTSWIAFSTTQHQRTVSCSVCGYTDTIQQNHSLVYGEWSFYTDQGGNDSVNHRRTVNCSACGYSDYEYEAHNMVRDFEGWRDSDNTWHYYTDTCSVCNYRASHYSQHVYDNNQKSYSDISNTQHRVTQLCKYCGYSNEFDENHTFTTTCESISNTRHKITSSCVCGHTLTSYDDHHDDDNDCYCDDCGYLMTRFSVTVPATLSLVMDKDGNVYTPTNAVITNNSTAPVKVTGISLSPQNGWTVVPYSTNMANQKVDSHKIGLKLRDSKSTSGNTMPLTGNWDIAKDSNLPLTYSAVVSATSQPITGSNVLDVTFVINWRD